MYLNTHLLRAPVVGRLHIWMLCFDVSLYMYVHCYVLVSFLFGYNNQQKDRNCAARIVYIGGASLSTLLDVCALGCKLHFCFINVLNVSV